MDETRLRARLNHFGHVAPQMDWGMSNHVHLDFHELIVVVGGTLEVCMQGERILGTRGDVLYYPRGEWHAEQARGPEPLETLFLAWQWEAGALSTALPLHTHDRNGRIQALVRWIGELFPFSRSEDAYMVNVLLNAVLHELQSLSQTQEQRLVAHTKRFMQLHLAEPLDLASLASEVGLSKYHFCRAFRQATGMAPMRFLRQLRVESARSLLLSTPWPLRRIAEQVGFSDEFQLSRVFRRVTGMPPSYVRRHPLGRPPLAESSQTR